MSKPIKLIGEPIRSPPENRLFPDWNSAWWQAAAQVMWRNAGSRSAMMNVLKNGICDGCSRSVIGSTDHQGETHRCLPQLQRLLFNTQSIFSEADVCDIRHLRQHSRQALQSLGRVGYPFIYRPGDRGLTRTSWSEALGLIGESVRKIPAHRQMYLAYSESSTNEGYYAFAKMARLMGSNNIHLCHSKVHRKGVSILERSLGVRTPTISFSDVLGTDLLLLVGCTYGPYLEDIIKQAQNNGARVVLLYTKDRSSERLLSLVDEKIAIHSGAEKDVVLGVAKLIWEWQQHDEEFVRCHTQGVERLYRQLSDISLNRCSTLSGVAVSQIDWLATLIARAKTMVTLYGEAAVSNDEVFVATKHILNIHLLKGAIGKPHSGVFPFWPQSGVYGAMESGIDPMQYVEGRSITEENAQWLSDIWGEKISAVP